MKLRKGHGCLLKVCPSKASGRGLLCPSGAVLILYKLASMLGPSELCGLAARLRKDKIFGAAVRPFSF